MPTIEKTTYGRICEDDCGFVAIGESYEAGSQDDLGDAAERGAHP